MKPPTRKIIVEWVLKSWSQLSNDMIKESFKCCGITIASDGSEDDIITSFKDMAYMCKWVGLIVRTGTINDFSC